MLLFMSYDFGTLGRAYVETDEARADEPTIIENILNGEYSQPLRVAAFNTAEGWARDVTEDIARAAPIRMHHLRTALRCVRSALYGQTQDGVLSCR